MVNGIPFSIEYWQLDPPIITHEASGPNNVGSIQDTSIFENGFPVADIYHARHALNTCPKKLLWRHTNYGVTSHKIPGSLHDPMSGRCIYSEAPHQRFEEDHPKFIAEFSVACRDKTGVPTSQPNRVLWRKV